MKSLVFYCAIISMFFFSSCSKEQANLDVSNILAHGVTNKQDFLFLAEARVRPFDQMATSERETFAESMIFDQNTLRGFNYKMLKDNLSVQDFILAYTTLFGQKVYFEFEEHSFERDWANVLKEHNATIGALRTYPICKLDRTPLPSGGCGDRKDDCCVE